MSPISRRRKQSEEPTLTHAVPEWAGTAVAWDPEVPGIDPVCTVPDAGSWTVAFSDFAPLADPIALEMRAESISQLVAGDALRCGACERVESTASSAGADIVAGRDRVTVHGRLREHTGGELAEMVAHLDTSVGGSLEVHAGQDDSVLVAGHMNDRWSGGAAVVAAVADDLVAGGGVRVTAPLDLWVHALMGVEERAATGSADVVLLELAATHYEREYNAGVHIARLAQFTGALYMTARTGFRALMEVSCGVRNLIPAPGAGDAGESPATTPPPAEGGAGAAAASETVSTATARSMHSVADGVARGGDELATLRHAQQGGEAAAHPQQYVAGINRLIDADFATTLDELGDVGHGAEVSELNHSADTAEQLAALQAGDSVRVGGDIPARQQQALDALLDSIDMRVAEARDQQGIPGRTGDLGEVSRVDADGPDGTHHAGDVADPDTAAPGLDGTPSQSPESDYWEGMYNRLVRDHANVQSSANQSAADPYRAAVDDIADQVLATYRRFGGEPGNLSQDASDIERAAEAHRALEDMLTEALRSSDGQRALDIRDALDEVNELTRLYFEDLTGRWAVSSPLSETYTWDTSWSSSEQSGRFHLGVSGKTGSGQRRHSDGLDDRFGSRHPTAGTRRRACKARSGSRHSAVRRRRTPVRPPVSRKGGTPRNLLDSAECSTIRRSWPCHAGWSSSSRSNRAH